VLAELPAETMSALDRLPEGEYAYEEVVMALSDVEDQARRSEAASEGVDAAALPDDLLRELRTLHRTRHETLRHGSEQALQRHTGRMGELEAEYLRRFPNREVDPHRERAGARQR
jgi:Family of unknown function (DUF6158)